MSQETQDSNFKDPFITFNFSKDHLKVLSALLKVQKEMGVAVKDENNPHFNKKYAGYKSVWDAVGSKLNENSVLYTMIPSGGPKLFTFCGLLIHESGEYLKASVEIEATRNGPQEFGSLTTYMKRYLLQMLTGVATDDEDDGNSATGKGDKPGDKPKDKPKSGYTPKPKSEQKPDSQQNKPANPIDVLLNTYKTLGVEKGQILDYFGYIEIAQITPKDVEKLREVWKQIVSKEVSVIDLFTPPIMEGSEDDFDQYMQQQQ